jgi:hypothetical protein
LLEVGFLAAGEDVGGGPLDAVVLELCVERRGPGAARGRDIEILDLRIEPRDLNTEVVLDGELHRFVGGEPADRPPIAGWRWLRGGGCLLRDGLLGRGQQIDPASRGSPDGGRDEGLRPGCRGLCGNGHLRSESGRNQGHEAGSENNRTHLSGLQLNLMTPC